MKRIWVAAIFLFLYLPANLFGQGLLPGEYPALSSLTDNVKVNPYAQAGFQWVGSNLNLPVENEAVFLPLHVGDLDISLKDANFWAGIAGINILAYEKYSLFGAAGGFLNRPFLTSGTVPVSAGGQGTSAILEFTNTKVESWFIQTGIGLGPVLLGLYWDHFAFALGDPRTDAGPIPNQTLRGDILTRTFCPFIGLAMPVSSAMLTVTYSPLAYSNTTLSLTSTQNTLAQLRYTWKKPGDLLNAMLQYNTPISSAVSFGLWGNYSWMRMRNEAELEFQNTPIPLLSRTREVTATMTKYVFGGGVTLGVNF
ncbi:MAG: hypothetical protein HY912_21310 [Desulfomonile tiedjei]|uniref:Uncharacterized protein n=1 Tax=Desulfomonile tiedjei TaxID=2358 RepID=A0A9D6V8T2_9BACT|nr:hypothetical protein [Desulfomonile tiedjei]